MPFYLEMSKNTTQQRDIYIYIYIYIYILEHRQNANNSGNRAQPLKRFFETLFLTIKKSADFTTDVI